MSVLVIGQHVWGYGDDLGTAKANFRKYGGRLTYGYTIFEFQHGLEFKGVDQLGYVHWTGKGEPRQTEVAPRKTR